jgi:DnaK suppressor protein
MINSRFPKMEVQMALTKQQLAKFEEQLVNWKVELQEGQNQSVHALHEMEQNSFPDPTDQASMETDLNFDLRIKDRERKLIRKIDQALDRIKEGDFGLCEACGGDIGVKRLQARPVTTLCIDCKTAQEQEERTRSE